MENYPLPPVVDTKTSTSSSTSTSLKEVSGVKYSSLLTSILSMAGSGGWRDGCQTAEN